MKVCDKCKKPLETKTTLLKFKKKNYEICDGCAIRITSWLDRPTGLSETFGSFLGGNY